MKYFIEKKIMKKFVKCLFHGIPRNFPWNFMKLRLMKFYGIQWNFVNSWNFMEFGFDRDGSSPMGGMIVVICCVEPHNLSVGF
jgi:hypothetical protein